MKVIVGLIIGGAIGAFLGFVAEPWFAQIAFKVRPGLETLNFWEAMFSDHFWAWLFMLHRTTMSIITTVLGAIIGVVVAGAAESST